jgi:hypothetical protein
MINKKSGAKMEIHIEYETDEIKSENKDLVVQNRNIVYAFSAIGLWACSFYYSKSKSKKELILNSNSNMPMKKFII